MIIVIYTLIPYCDITQEETLEQERARLDALRQRDQERLKRFMDAKNRSIGIDKDYLDKQVEEKRRLEGVYVCLCLRIMMISFWYLRYFSL